MYILVKEENVILNISETLNRQEGTNYYLINNDNEAIPTEFVKNVYEIKEIPLNIEAEKYCYDGKDFTKNPNYIEYYNEEDRISALEDIVNMILIGGE